MDKEIYFVVPMQKILRKYINEHFRDHPITVLRLPMTGAVRFDSWIDHGEVVFRVTELDGAGERVDDE